MSVDVNNNFNNAEDKIQYALGTMQAYSVVVEHICKHTITGGACYPGIIALNCSEALTKFLHFYNNSLNSSTHDDQDLTLRITLCE